MRHKYFRFLACVAMVLACVLFFEVPASAVTTINIADYFTSSTSQSGNVVKKYFVPHDSYKASISETRKSEIGYEFTQNPRFGTHAEVTLNKDYEFYSFNFYPFYDSYNSTGVDQYNDDIPYIGSIVS